jgi:hypothetical protein
MRCPKDKLIPVWEKNGVILHACSCGEFHHYRPKRGKTTEGWVKMDIEHVRYWITKVHHPIWRDSR